ncbi:MAG TPA: TraR/DksA C4-type zinc finger protein [Acidimicrobiales bacterium]|jgi:RNA polymerase-binding transcription factor DksA
MANDASTRPSDAQVRTWLEGERARLTALRGELTEDVDDEGTGEELSAVDQHPADTGTDVESRTGSWSVLEQVSAGLAAVDDAFERLERGVYGRCAICGEAIDPERLAALPATRYCLRHQQQVDEDRGRPSPSGTTSPRPI